MNCAAATFASLPQVICATGGFRGFLSIPPLKNIRLLFFGKLWFTLAIPPCQKGRIAIVTNVGWDAVDVSSATDERAAGGRRSRVVLAPRSRRQVRKTPTRRADDGVNKAVVPGKSTEETVKPSRGECRMFPVPPL